jgi:glycosyltransferase involved in cell wall biosynthesis
MLKQCALAIIIPAYKPEYLAKTLQSIADQTCKDFNLYIGDDCSPYKLHEIIRPFEKVLDFEYCKFDNNLGGTNLIAQWDRCIELSSNEGWIWLFSDDDIMSDSCVEMFYKNLSTYPEEVLFHIDLNIIDDLGNISHRSKKFPTRISGPELFSEKLKLKISSTVVEYIFKRSNFREKGGFERFDLAWNSDDATWIKLIGNGEVLTIEDCKVFWRYSSLNISSLLDKAVIMKKTDANLEYLAWAASFFKKNGIAENTSGSDKIKWLMQMVKESNHLSIREKLEICVYITKKLRRPDLNFFGILYLLYSSIKQRYQISSAK